MANSLQDQLLKLGLVDQQKLRQNKQEQRKQAKQNPGKPGPAEERRRQVQQEQVEKAERDRQLNRQRQEEAERQATAAQVRQLIEGARLPKGDGDVAYNFVDGSKVRRVYVNPAVHRQLTDGSAAIAKLRGKYEIVPRDVAEKIRERNPAYLVTAAEVATSEAVDDAYAKFQVPDDLMW